MEPDWGGCAIIAQTTRNGSPPLSRHQSPEGDGAQGDGARTVQGHRLRPRVEEH
jgi:hypothetical protein